MNTQPMGKNFRETLNKQLQNPEFRAEWDALESERQIMRTIIDGCDERDGNKSEKTHPIEYRS